MEIDNIYFLLSVVDRTRFEEVKKDDTMRPDSVDSSSRCLSSPNSVEIFLPQIEGTHMSIVLLLKEMYWT